MKKTVSLVLGSGGARGMVHVGVIKYLEENDYIIQSISGSSIGALVGGFYAAGKLDAYVDWIYNLDKIDMMRLLDFKGSGGLISGNTLMKEFTKLLGDHKIEELEIKYTAVATDLTEEKEIWLTKGSLINAIRASISLPLFFTPYNLNGRDLIDGGVLNPVPIAPTFNDETDLSIAVNLGGKVDSSYETESSDDNISTSQKILSYLQGITNLELLNERKSIYTIADNSFDTMQGTIARMKLAAYPPDIEIEFPRNLCGTLEFTRAEEMIEHGYQKCKEVLDEEKK